MLDGHRCSPWSEKSDYSTIDPLFYQLARSKWCGRMEYGKQFVFQVAGIASEDTLSQPYLFRSPFFRGCVWKRPGNLLKPKLITSACFSLYCISKNTDTIANNFAASETRGLAIWETLSRRMQFIYCLQSIPSCIMYWFSYFFALFFYYIEGLNKHYQF